MWDIWAIFARRRPAVPHHCPTSVCYLGGSDRGRIRFQLKRTAPVQSLFGTTSSKGSLCGCFAPGTMTVFRRTRVQFNRTKKCRCENALRGSGLSPFPKPTLVGTWSDLDPTRLLGVLWASLQRIQSVCGSQTFTFMIYFRNTNTVKALIHRK